MASIYIIHTYSVCTHIYTVHHSATRIVFVIWSASVRTCIFDLKGYFSGIQINPSFSQNNSLRKIMTPINSLKIISIPLNSFSFLPPPSLKMCWFPFWQHKSILCSANTFIPNTIMNKEYNLYTYIKVICTASVHLLSELPPTRKAWEVVFLFWGRKQILYLHRTYLLQRNSVSQFLNHTLPIAPHHCNGVSFLQKRGIQWEYSTPNRYYFLWSSSP